MSDEYLNETLAFTDAKRREMIRQMEELSGGKLPSDPKEANLYLKALSDMDSAALTHTRVKTEEKQANNDAQVAQVMRDVSRRLNGVNPFMVEAPVGRPAPELPKEIEGEIQVDAAQTESGVVQETVEEFNRRMGNDED